MRKSIDYFDTSFLYLLAERMRLIEKIMHIKQERKIELTQSEARKADMEKLIEMSVELKLETKLIRKILDLVFHDAMEQYGQEKHQIGPGQIDRISAGLSLKDLRNSLFNLDRSLCIVLAERFRVVKRIGKYKDELQVPPLDKARWQQVLEGKAKIARTLGIKGSLVKDIFDSIHQISLSIEDIVMETYSK